MPVQNALEMTNGNKWFQPAIVCWSKQIMSHSESFLERFINSLLQTVIYSSFARPSAAIILRYQQIPCSAKNNGPWTKKKSQNE